VSSAQPFKDYYSLLGLSPYADLDVVKSTYRKLARQYHPDLNGGNKAAEERFKQINEAYAVLGNAEKKSQFDQALRLKNGWTTPDKPNRPESTKSPQGKTTPNATQKTSKEKPQQASSKGAASVSDPFQEFIDSFIPKKPAEARTTGPKTSKNNDDPIFWKKAANDQKDRTPRTETFKQASEQTSEPKRRGEDVTVETVISPTDAEQGTVKTVNVQHKDLCRQCAATGKFNGRTCTACNGEGLLSKLKKIDVRIPGGVRQGSKVRVAGEGGRGLGGRENGDLFLLIKVDVDETLRIEGLDVYYDLELPVVDAVLGTSVEVPTLNGPVSVTIPPLTSSGKVLRLKGLGAKSGANQGDQFVTIAIVAPEHLTPQQRELFEQLRSLSRGK